MKNIRVLAIVALASLGVAAVASPPDPLDYTAMIGEFSTSFGEFVATNGLAIMVALIGILTFGLVLRLVRKLMRGAG